MQNISLVSPPNFLRHPTRHLFFTGKGGVGKTSVACGTALALAETGSRVLLVSTDPASNLDEMLGVSLGNTPVPIPDVPGLWAMNIDPEAAAEAYRGRVLAQMPSDSAEPDRNTVREQLSGACTTEIAAFDEFAGLLAGEAAAWDHVVFDTAPTGHTIRLLSLPKAWTGFLEGNDRGASCLGPHSGLKLQEERFRQALEALGNPDQTTILLVTRADRAALNEAWRTAAELQALGLGNQRLIVNAVFHASGAGDAVATALEHQGQTALAAMPAPLAALPRDEVPMHGFDMVGLPALRAMFAADHSAAPVTPAPANAEADLPGLDRLIDELSVAGKGLVMVMGKGGVGKTTVAAAVAVGLVRRGHTVHLSTTDPAAHLTQTLAGELPDLKVDRIDPRAETERYIERVMATRGRDLDEPGRALLREDLASPCTEEVAVFHAFSRTVAEARTAFVVLDTAPTGHTLLLLDATGAYHRQMTRDIPSSTGRVVTPLMRLQDPQQTRVLLVALPETTPVSEAAALQDDLRRARIEPYAWVINRSLLAAGTRDTLLRQRLVGEQAQIERVRTQLARRMFVLPWQVEPPIGLAALARISG
jgi:arsenite-transporting ATPase